MNILMGGNISGGRETSRNQLKLQARKRVLTKVAVNNSQKMESAWVNDQKQNVVVKGESHIGGRSPLVMLKYYFATKLRT